MSLQAILYYAILTAAMAISITLALYTWRHRQTAGARPFSLMMLALFGWSLAYLIQILSPDLAAQAFWNKITFIGVVTTPVFWFLFSWNIRNAKPGSPVHA